MKKANNKLSLKVENLGFSYPGISEPALDNISFSLKPNTINILIGPNGSGKSTLLKSILGILSSSGEITFYDEKGEKISRKESHIGYVPQKFNFDTSIPITVNEFLKLTLSSCKRHTGGSENQISKALKEVNATNLRYKKLGDLSGGQLQRIILARALFHHPKLLILDEPESGIDMEGERFFYEVLDKLVKEKRVTALIASHEMEIVNKYADQVLCINKTIVCAGSSAQALTDKTFSKLYGSHNKPHNHVHTH